MKKTLIIIVAAMLCVGVLAGAGFASATTLTINSEPLQSGYANLTTDVDGVNLEWRTSVGGSGEFRVYQILVTGIDAPDGASVLIGLFTHPLPPPGGSTFTTPGFLIGTVTGGEAICDFLTPLTPGNGPTAASIESVSVLVKNGPP